MIIEDEDINMSVWKMFVSVCVVVVLILGSASLFVVYEGQHALVTRFGKLKAETRGGEPVEYAPGLHMKVPGIEKVLKFDTRLRTLDIQSSRIMTVEQKEVIVDYFVKWRINNLPLYYTRTSGQDIRAKALLTQQVNDGLRAEFGKRTIQEVVSDDRAKIMKALNEKADGEAKKLGVDVIDVRIKRIDLPDEVSISVFDRMRAERERVAKEHRSQGQARAEGIRADADAEATIMVAEAKAQSNHQRSEGDAMAAKVYADSYNKDAEFYAFYRSLLAYTQSFNSKNDVLLLTPESQFFNYFNNLKGIPAEKHKKAA
jgi:modulator of FtsH protease HflC